MPLKNVALKRVFFKQIITKYTIFDVQYCTALSLLDLFVEKKMKPLSSGIENSIQWLYFEAVS